MKNEKFQIGIYRSIYLWAGSGTIRMNQVKFMQVRVDNAVHLSAHQPEGASIVVNKMLQNWIHLSYSWGFPPEIEVEDWISFQEGANVYHQKGVKVFAYIQSSNCVYQGSFKQKNWYATDPSGRKFYYYTNRYMTCFSNLDWTNYLKERIQDAILRGADGIFFDNLWYGCQPTALFNNWLGSAGCFCKSCRENYLDETGDQIPEIINPAEPLVSKYLRWRANKMSAVFRDLSDFARNLKPDVIISANDYDCILRPSYLVYGIDFPVLSSLQDLSMIENFALPVLQTKKETRFVNNALTVRTALSFLNENQHLSVLSYDVGIGFDPVYPTRRFLQGIAEAAALGASMTTKGTEYYDGTAMTLLTAPDYGEQQTWIGKLNSWLFENQNLFTNRKNIAKIALLHPGDGLWQKWFQLAPPYFGCGQTLTANGFPWKVLRNTADLDEINYLFTFDNEVIPDHSTNRDLTIINIPDIPKWNTHEIFFLENHKTIRKFLSSFTEALIRAYHGNKIVRKMLDLFGMAKLVTQTPLYFMPDKQKQITLLETISEKFMPSVKSESPVLLDIWKKSTGEIQYHLVNYSEKSQQIVLTLPNSQSGIIKQPFNLQEIKFINQNKISFDLDIYAICIVSDQTI